MTRPSAPAESPGRSDEGPVRAGSLSLAEPTLDGDRSRRSRADTVRARTYDGSMAGEEIVIFGPGELDEKLRREQEEG